MLADIAYLQISFKISKKYRWYNLKRMEEFEYCQNLLTVLVHEHRRIIIFDDQFSWENTMDIIFDVIL